MNTDTEIPCFYCDGTGYAGDRQTDVDRREPSDQCCDECQGTGASSRVAGARYTGYPRVSDPLLRLRHLRTHYIREARSAPYTPSYRRLSVEECRVIYEHARAAACREVGGAR